MTTLNWGNRNRAEATKKPHANAGRVVTSGLTRDQLKRNPRPPFVPRNQRMTLQQRRAMKP
jgi:hypothetical protein